MKKLHEYILHTTNQFYMGLSSNLILNAKNWIVHGIKPRIFLESPCGIDHHLCSFEVSEIEPIHLKELWHWLKELKFNSVIVQFIHLEGIFKFF